MLRPATVHRSSCISLSGSSLHSASAPPIERPRPKNAPRRLQLRTDIFDELEGTEAGRNSAVALGVALPYPEPPSLSVRPARTGGRDNVTNESALEVVSTSLEDEMPQTGFCLGGRFPHPPLSPGLLQSFPSSPNLAQSFLAPLRRLSTGRLDELVGANKANEVDAEQYDSAGRTFWTPSMDDLRDTPSPPPTCSSRLGRTRSFHSPLTRLRSSPVSLRALAAAGHTFRPSDGQYENSNSDSENFTGCIVPSTSTSSSISNPIIAAADMFPMPPTCEPEPPQPKLVRSPSFGDSLTRALRRSQIGLAHGQGGLTANGAERERDGKEIDGDEDEDGWRDVVRTRERTRRELEARRREVMDLVVIA